MAKQSGQVKMNRSAEIALEREERDANEEAVADESVAEVDWDADAESPPRQQERSPQLSPYAHLSAAVRELQQNGSVNTDVYRAGDRVTGHLGSIECDQWGLNGAEEEEVQHAIAGVRFIAGHQRVEEEIQQCKEDWKFVALVLDRFFLCVFTTACVVGTLSIILQAPSLYDVRHSILD